MNDITFDASQPHLEDWPLAIAAAFRNAREKVAALEAYADLLRYWPMPQHVPIAAEAFIRHHLEQAAALAVATEFALWVAGERIADELSHPAEASATSTGGVA